MDNNDTNSNVSSQSQTDIAANDGPEVATNNQTMVAGVSTSEKRNRVVMIVLGVILILTIALIAALALQQRNTASSSQNNQQANQETQEENQNENNTQPDDDTSDETTSQRFDDDFVSFEYPEGWTAEVKSGANLPITCTEPAETFSGVQSIKLTKGGNSIDLEYNGDCAFGYAGKAPTFNLNNLGTVTQQVNIGEDETFDYKMGNVLYFKKSTALDRYVFVLAADPLGSDGKVNDLRTRVVYSFNDTDPADKITMDIEYTQANMMIDFIGKKAQSSGAAAFTQVTADTDAKSLEEAKEFVEAMEMLFTTAKRK